MVRGAVDTLIARCEQLCYAVEIASGPEGTRVRLGASLSAGIVRQSGRVME